MTANEGAILPWNRVTVDPEVTRQVEAYVGYNKVRDDVVIYNNIHTSGLVGIAEPEIPDHRYEAEKVSEATATNLIENFDVDSPEGSMHDAYVAGNREAEHHISGVRQTFMRFFDHKNEGVLRAVYGINGAGPIFRHARRGWLKGREISMVTPQTDQDHQYLNGQPVSLRGVKTGEIAVHRGDRFILVNKALATPEAVRVQKKYARKNPRALANKLVEGVGRTEDAAAIVVEVSRKKAKVAAMAGKSSVGGAAPGTAAGAVVPAAAGTNGAGAAGGTAPENTTSPEPRSRRRGILALVAGALVVGGLLAWGLSDAINNGHNNKNGHPVTSPSHSTSASPSRSPSSSPSTTPSTSRSTSPSSSASPTGSAGGSGGGGSGGSGAGSGSAESAPIGQTAGAPFVVEGGHGLSQEIVQYAASQGKVINIDRGFKIYLDVESHVQPNDMIVLPGGGLGTYKMHDGHYGIREATRDAHWTTNTKRIIDADLAAA